MDPLILYVSLFLAALIVCAVATMAWRPPTRACMSCGEETPVQGKRCRSCGYPQAAR